MAFTTLGHHIDVALLGEAFERTNWRSAPGVDGVTARTYMDDFGSNLRSLLERAKSGTYRAPPVRRVHIPKGSGTETRPIGIPTLEDKVLQRAVCMILEAIYEQDFLDCSYGFRPGRSVHQAIETLWKQTMQMGGCWLLEVDIRKFFDTLDHSHLRDLLQLRVRDGVLRRLIHKWLKAGVMEDGSLHYPTEGTPQGGVISPLLANVYLHEVLDKWFEHEVKPGLKGRAFLVRYADDLVIGFSEEADARRVMAMLPERFGSYGLSIHPEKTRLIDFRHPKHHQGPKAPGGGGLPRTFDFLAFTHFWGTSRKGNRVVQRKTAKKRFNRSLLKVAEWCRRNRHLKVAVQHVMLCLKVRGHYQFYGITGNYRALARFVHEVERVWRKWLDRRSEKRRMPWERFKRLLARYPLPAPQVAHTVYRSVAKP